MQYNVIIAQKNKILYRQLGLPRLTLSIGSTHEKQFGL